jgi:hypothetical protein
LPEFGVKRQKTMNMMDYQLYPAYKSLAAPRKRILSADAVGLRKTLGCGIDFGNPSNFLELTATIEKYGT